MPTSIPASARATAVALPMPESEPVTIAVVGEKLMPRCCNARPGRTGSPRAVPAAPRPEFRIVTQRALLGWCAVPEPERADLTDPDWWRSAVVYQIYPRSFADGNADGIGDFAGLIERIPYLARLGVDAVWLSPFYPSALADGGYDVADYRDVDPRLGTLDDFDAMVAALHAEGIRVVVDIVPNHTSNLHAWFQEALASP